MFHSGISFLLLLFLTLACCVVVLFLFGSVLLLFLFWRGGLFFFPQLSPVLNSCIGYILCGALGYRLLREKHKSLMWHEVLAIGPAMGDVCVVVLFLFAIVRKGARRQGYVRYEAVLPGTELELGN